ncbi:hypothetical protein ACZ90_09780 [Streptomyces albus subsp. albus]|nr:hypothetical protein ACZ90_09780 [Streptomyces albus subsp. albus]
MVDVDLHALLDDPAAVLRADRSGLRDGLADSAPGGGGRGREVFTQAEAVFGRAEVGRAEFASWLHFAATVLGHHEYAERVAAAEPGLPWRTVWAWWRPVGAYEAVPNLSGDRSAEVFDWQGRALVKVWAIWCEDAWFDLATGRRCPAPPAGEAVRREEREPVEPWLFDTEEDGWAVHCSGAWEEPMPLGEGRYLLLEARGVVVVEQNDAALASWPRGGADPSSWEEADDEPWFMPGTRGDGPLTAARLDEVFGADWVTRIPGDQLPDALEHPATRAVLSILGLPRHWAAGVTSFEIADKPLLPLSTVVPEAAEEAGPAAGLPDPGDLLHLGTFEFGYGDEGTVCVDRTTGAVYVRREDDEPEPGPYPVFPLSRDVESFIRFLEGVRRHMGACWDRYPAESGTGAFLDAMRGVDAEALEDGTPAARVWEHVFASITELSVWGY